MDGLPSDIPQFKRILELQFMQSFTTGNLIIDALVKGTVYTLDSKTLLDPYWHESKKNAHL